MVQKLEQYAKTAQMLVNEEAIVCEFGPVKFRGCEYRAPVTVTILNRPLLQLFEQETAEKVVLATQDVNAGVYGAGTALSESKYALDFIRAVLNREYPPCPGAMVPATPAPIAVQEPAQAPQEPAQNPAGTTTAGLDVLAQVVADVVARTAGAGLEQAIADKAIAKVQEFVATEYGPIQKRIEIITPAGEVKPVQGMLHKAFDEVLAYVQADEPVFLVGPAGCGKNVLCKQVAEAMGLEFYFSNAVTQEYKITGFTDAMGVFQESQFYKAFTQGGLFFLDEMDASISEVLLILNSAIANRYFDFPAPIGRVEAHPDFRVISAGNTVGQGASFEYVGRNQLDASSLDRFAVIPVDYDEAVELNVAGGDAELVEFIHAVRGACESKGISLIASYRAIGRIAKMAKALPLDKVLRSCLFKGMDKMDIEMIAKACPAGNRYTKATKAL